jgi:YhcH/YjgK/YiaL family protein
MALLGSLSTLREQSALARLHPSAFAYLAEALDPASAVHRRILDLPTDRTDRIELEDGIFVLEQAYLPKARNEGRFEAHRRYIDLQAIIAGNELMEVVDVARLRVSEDLTPERDVLFYHDAPGASVLRVVPGDIAVFYPVDAHMPSLADGTPAVVRKAVVKVPVSA